MATSDRTHPNHSLADISSSASGGVLDRVIFAPPVDVDTLSRCCAAGAVGAVDPTTLVPRVQDFVSEEEAWRPPGIGGHP